MDGNVWTNPTQDVFPSVRVLETTMKEKNITPTQIHRFHVYDEGTVKTMDFQKRIGSKEGENGCIGRQVYDNIFLRCTQDNVEMIG